MSDHKIIENNKDSELDSAKKETSPGALQTLGLHPLSALVLVVLDNMLFVGEGVTLGASWLISIPVGIVFGVGTALIQKSEFGDNLTVSIAKGLLIALITAIPTAVPAFLTAGSGVLGLLHTIKKK